MMDKSKRSTRPTYDMAGWDRGARFSEGGLRLIELGALLEGDFEAWDAEVPSFGTILDLYDQEEEA